MEQSEPKPTFVIREAGAPDAQHIAALLMANAQSAHAVCETGNRYWIAQVRQKAIGTIGLELGAGVALLRSAAVLAPWRGHGIGDALVRAALDAASETGYEIIYLFSTGVGGYWQRWGFVEVPVAEVIAALPNAPQVRQYAALGLLASEVAWRRSIERGA